MKKQITHVILLALTLLFSSLAQAAVVNMNKANVAAMVENLQGIGPKKAAAIVSYRQSVGSFKSLDDLLNVKGIGEKTLMKIKGDMSLSKGVIEVEGIVNTASKISDADKAAEISTENKSSSKTE